VEVFARGARVALLRLDFLHDGLPVMDLRACWAPGQPGQAGPAASAGLPGSAGLAVPGGPAGRLAAADLRAALHAVLADPNVCSREEWVRQYDHEVQARSVVKPFVGVGRDAPSDGAVLRVRPGSRRGITVTHGICPRYGDDDAYSMAQCAVDEAVRAHVALGGDPGRMSALDNFCWPDPVEGPGNPDGAFKLGQLVRACRGLADACDAFSLPLISGKDSMKNDARVGGRKISIRPTLLVSLMGIVPDVARAVTTDFKEPGDLLYLVGETRGEMGGTIFERITGTALGPAPSARPAEAMRSYGRLHRAMRRGLVRSCHDLSDGGLWASLAESSLGGRLGAEVDLDAVPVAAATGREPARILFCETPSRFLVSVAPRSRSRWERVMRGVPCAAVGTVTADGIVRLTAGGAALAAVTVEEARRAWSGEGRESA
jgi:phosphoribosylformylglycinamidine synthase